MIRILGSYHYLKNLDITGAFGPVPGGVDFFADSGAFSAQTIGAQITLAEYAEWLTHHRGVVNAAATLDVIGDWRRTARNTDVLAERVGDAVVLVPTFHVGSPWSEFRRLCAAWPYVALGGMVRLAGRGYERSLSSWFAHAHLIARDHDVRLHGFGLTRPPFPEVAPWYSVDSAYWMSAGRTGSLSLWDDRARRWCGFRVGTETARKHARLIARYGADPRRVCAYGFGVVSRVGEVARDQRTWLGDASARSWLRYEAHLQTVKPTVEPPRGGRVAGTGIKVYLAVNSRAQFRQALRACTMEGMTTTVEGATSA